MIARAFLLRPLPHMIAGEILRILVTSSKVHGKMATIAVCFHDADEANVLARRLRDAAELIETAADT